MVAYISADSIHDGYRFLPKGSVIEVDVSGTILSIHDGSKISHPVTHHEGIICPGFVNAHCHLELSHLKGAIPNGTGLVEFIMSIPKLRYAYSQDQIAKAMYDACEELVSNGTVAVGDIANGTTTLSLLKKLPFHLHTFIETMGVLPASAADRLHQSQLVLNEYANQAHLAQPFEFVCNLVPHAPYSVSEKLLSAVYDNNKDNSIIISVHNQESAAELLFFEDRTGAMLQLYQALNIDIEDLDMDTESSLEYILNESRQLKWLLVHNTFTTQKDIDFIKENGKNVVFCLCPNANWYIEQTLPNIHLLQKSGLPICLGTDSLASNWELNIWSEIKRIQTHYPEISLETLINWATINGAEALGFDHKVGSFGIGKQPGILLISGHNKVKRIL